MRREWLKWFALPVMLLTMVFIVGSQEKTSFYKQESTFYAIEIIGPDGEFIVRVKGDGSVEYGEGFTKDAAAKAFWEELGKAYVLRCEAARTEHKPGGSHE